MTYDSPLWASEGWVILEVFSFKEEGLVTPEAWEGEKGMLKVCWSKGEIEPGSPAWNARVMTTTPIETLFQDEAD